MPTRPNTQPIHLTVPLTKLFRDRWAQERKKNPTVLFGTVVNEFIRKAVYFEEQMELAKDHMEYVRPIDDSLLFIDKDKKQSVIIEIRGPNTLFCENDNTDNCRHVGFAWTVPEVLAKLKEHGFKPPRQT